MKDIYVYAKYDKSNTSNNSNIGGCVNYMIRYASHPPMVQSRITYYNKKTDERIIVNESGRSLLEKMIIPISDNGFRMVRYYGFYNMDYISSDNPFTGGYKHNDRFYRSSSLSLLSS